MNGIRNVLAICLSFFAVSCAFYPEPALTHRATEEIIVSYRFEDGRMPPPMPYPNKIRAAILTDPDGNHFLRIIGSPEDTGPRFNTTPPTVRNEVLAYQLDLAAKPRVTFSWSMRRPSNVPYPETDAILMQWFQNYGGPAIWMRVGDFQKRVGTVDNWQSVKNNPPIPYDKWVNFSLDVYWTTDPDRGRAAVYMDGKHLGSMTGATAINSGTMDLYLNIYGGPGTVDFDNIEIRTDAAAPTARSSGAAESAIID
jgi:hypothetical protein